MPITKKTLEKYLVEIRRIAQHRTEGSEKKIRRIYKMLQKDLQLFLANQYEKYAIDDQLTYAILQQKGQYANFLENVQKHVDEISPQLSKEITQTVKDTYKTCFDGMIDCVKKAVAGKAVLNEVLSGVRTVTPSIIKRAVENPISGLTLADTLEKNRKEIIYNIKQNIGIGLVNGDRYSTMARRITDTLDGDYKKSIRIVRTETHRNIEAGLHDSATEINDTFTKNDVGVHLAKIWRTMKDERVRPNKRRTGTKRLRSYLGIPNHVKMEGVSVKENELFELGEGIKTRAPGESGVAGHDINCRCFLEWEIVDETKTAKSFEVSNEKDIIKLTDDEQYAVNSYISSESYKINDKLRNSLTLSESDKKLIYDLDNALDKMPNYHGDVSRSLDFSDKKSLENFLSGFAIGNKINFKSYTSTTCGTELYNPDANVQIFITKSTKGKDIRKYNPDETEILYKRNSEFEVFNMYVKDKVTYIFLEER